LGREKFPTEADSERTVKSVSNKDQNRDCPRDTDLGVKGGQWFKKGKP